MRKPLAKPVDATLDGLLFQQLDIDYVVDKPHETLGNRRSKGDAAVVRMFGVTGDGHSVCGAHRTDLSRTFVAPRRRILARRIATRSDDD